MIAVTPAKNQDQIKEVFNELGQTLSEKSMAVTAVENNKQIGCAAFNFDGEELTLLSVKYPKNDIFVCDLISRGVMNFGVNRNILYCELGPDAPIDEFVKLGFIKSKAEASVNIIKAFMECKSCKSKQQN